MKNLFKTLSILVLGIALTFTTVVMVQASFTPVIQGGTGVQSFTPSAIITGGTAQTSAVQQLGFGVSGQILTSNGNGALATFQTPATNGTVTNFSIATAQGFNGSVSNATTTPNLTIGTTVTGITKGSGGSLVAATGDSDYQNPITLTTIGSSGAATFSGDILNIPQYTGGGGGSGTVTSVSVVTNHGVSGTVATSTTTPAITISLGALTGVTSYNGLIVTPDTGVITTGTWNGTAVGTTYGGTGATSLGASLTNSGSVLGINLANANTWTAAQTVSTAPFTISGSQSATQWLTAGQAFKTVAATYTDTSSTTGTVATNMINSFGIPTLVASNTGITYTNAATVYIAGAPVASTNVTVTNPWSLQVQGPSLFSSNATFSASIFPLNVIVGTGGSVTGAATGVPFTFQTRGFTAANTAVSAITGTMTQSSGQFNGFAITPTYNQTSTAAATDLLVNRTETAVGTGAQRLIDLQVAGTSKFNVSDIGKMSIATGANSSIGTGTLSSGTVTISTTAVTASSEIFLTDTTTGALTNVGSLTVGTKTAGTSFVVNSTNVLDSSTFNWLIIN